MGGFLGSQPTNYSNALDMVTIASTGNATDFADVTQRGQQTSCASSTRALTGGVYAGAQYNIIDFFTMSSTANGVDFGDLSITGRGSWLFIFYKEEYSFLEIIMVALLLIQSNM